MQEDVSCTRAFASGRMTWSEARFPVILGVLTLMALSLLHLDCASLQRGPAFEVRSGINARITQTADDRFQLHVGFYTLQVGGTCTSEFAMEALVADFNFESEGSGQLFRITAGRDHGVSGRQGRADEIGPQTTTGSGDQPDLLVRAGLSHVRLLFRKVAATIYTRFSRAEPLISPVSVRSGARDGLPDPARFWPDLFLKMRSVMGVPALQAGTSPEHPILAGVFGRLRRQCGGDVCFI